MEDDAEVLDWGHDDDDQAAQRPLGDARDVEEDTVSLGGDEDDMQDLYAYHTAEQVATKVPAQLPNYDPTDERAQPDSTHDTSAQGQSTVPSQDADSQLRRSQSIGKLTHALPPKPVVFVAPVHPSPAQTSTLASAMVQRERRSNGHGNSSSVSNNDLLPPDWEVRQARSGAGEQYYYNTKTHESTWTRPAGVPLKDREGGVGRDDRSPRRDAGSPERRANRRELKRSADDLSYEDRHYRPGGPAATSSGAEVTDRGARMQGEVLHTPGRPVSPRPLSERRRSRSLSPPRRDHPDKVGRSHRDQTPPRALIGHGTWRDAERQDRVHHEGLRGDYASRTLLDTGPLPAQNRDSRTRGRPERADVYVPSQYTSERDQTNRRGHGDWSAQRTRSSPPHVRPPSPLGAHRLSRGSSPGSPQTSTVHMSSASKQRPRLDKPVNPPRPPSPRSYGDYSPVESLPQRRGREPDSVGAEFGYESKRRRVHDRYEEPPTLRQPQALEMAPPHGLPPRPQAPLLPLPVQAEHSRPRKRAPLPPQSTRFREASTRSAPPSVSPPSPIDTSRRGYFEPPRGPSRDDDVSMRYANSPADLPSNPRRQGPPAAADVKFDGRGYGSSVRPSMSSRPNSRFDDLPPVSPRDHLVRTERDPTEVDRLTIAPTRRGHDGPSRPMTMYADRMNDVVPDAPPRGPRAMAGGREPPPYDMSTQRPQITGMQAFPPPQSTGSTWNSRPVARPVFENAPIMAMPQPPVTSYQNGPQGLPPPPSVSGTNLIPIGNRKAPAGREPEAPHSPQDTRGASFSNAYPASRTGPIKAPARSEYDRRDSFYSSGLPYDNTNKPHPSEDSRSRRHSVSSSGRPEIVAGDRPPSRFMNASGLPPRPREDGRMDSGKHSSRFGGESSVPPGASGPEPRIWMTREESEKRALQVPPPEHHDNFPLRTPVTVYDQRQYPDPPPTRHGNHARGKGEGLDDLPSRPSFGENMGRSRRQPEYGQHNHREARESPVDTRLHGQRLSFEGRLGPQQNDRFAPPTLPAPLPPRPVDHDADPEPGSRPDFCDGREPPPREANAPWDIIGPDDPRDVSPSAARVHPDRARFLQSMPVPSQMTEEPLKTSKPVRIRRPPPMVRQPEATSPVPDRREAVIESHCEDTPDVDSRPNMPRRTGSLLDRLSLTDSVPWVPEASSPSLRERVDAFSHASGVPDGDYPGDFSMDVDMEGNGGNGNRGGRKRGQRPRRGRRGGIPA